MRKPKKEDWLKRVNGRAKTRTFGDVEWVQFEKQWSKCLYYARLGRSFYWTIDAGGVANRYKYATTTAVTACWVSPDTHEPVWAAHRETISGPHVRCAYIGGLKSYNSDFQTFEKMKKWNLFTQYCEEQGITRWRQFDIFKSVKNENQAIQKVREHLHAAA